MSDEKRGWIKSAKEDLDECNCSVNNVYKWQVALWLIASLLISGSFMGILLHLCPIYADIERISHATASKSYGDASVNFDMPEFAKIYNYLKMALSTNGGIILLSLAACIWGFCCGRPKSKRNHTTTQCCHTNWRSWLLVLFIAFVFAAQIAAIIATAALIFFVGAEMNREFYPEIRLQLRNVAEGDETMMDLIENKYHCCGVEAVTGGFNPSAPSSVCQQHTTEVPTCTKALQSALQDSTSFFILTGLALVQLVFIFFAGFNCCNAKRSPHTASKEQPSPDSVQRSTRTREETEPLGTTQL